MTAPRYQGGVEDCASKGSFIAAGSTRCYLTPYGFEGQPFSDPPPRPGFAALGPENPSSIPHPLRVALHRVDQEIQHMLENARLLAKVA
jgi:hypothetical protein